MSSSVVCDSKSPGGIATDLNLQGNGHHSHTLMHFACINTWHITRTRMRPHAHANMCAAFMYSHKVGVSVYLSSFDTPLLLLLGYKPFSVPGAPLAMSDWFGLSFLCLTVSVVGQLCCTVSSCYRLLITPKKKQTGRLNNLGWTRRKRSN